MGASKNGQVAEAAVAQLRDPDLLQQSKLVLAKALEVAAEEMARNRDWVALEDVPEKYGIKKSADWLRTRWRREPGAPRPSKVIKGVYPVKRAEIDAWLDGLRAEDQEAVLRKDELIRRRASGGGRARLSVPDPHHG